MALSDDSYQIQGALAPEPDEDQDPITELDGHALGETQTFHARYGDRPTPEEWAVYCECGEIIWNADEASAITGGTPEENHIEHLNEVAADQG